MQFQVPQFIEVEDKIIGPLTLKQFIYLGIAGMFSFILFFILQTWLWVICTSFLGIIAASFAFIKYNGRPMMITIMEAFRYFWQPKFYLWHRTNAGPALPTIHSLPKMKQEGVRPLKDLMLKMNTSKEAIENREKSFAIFDVFKKSKELLEKYEVVQKETGEEALYKRVDYR